MSVRTKKIRRTPTRSRRPPGSLRLYNAKRNLAESGEPGGRATDQPREAVVRKYVIQKHDATRLHFDFRLEMAGVLRSWAVPKGLPMKAGERVLAVEVEDHPLGYGSFEGTIPAGNYGAGTVMLWDQGDYTVAEGTPEEAFRRGKIHLALSGQKCVGEWTLVRMHPRPGDRSTNWLLIKNSGPAHEAPMSGAELDVSVSTRRTMEEIASGQKGAASREGAKSAKGRSGKVASSRLRASQRNKVKKKIRRPRG